MTAQIGLGYANLAGGTLQEGGDAFRRYIELARRMGNEGELSAGLNGLGDVQVARGDLVGALKSYNDSLAIADRLSKSDPGNEFTLLFLGNWRGGRRRCCWSRAGR